jgi:CrcB protein
VEPQGETAAARPVARTGPFPMLRRTRAGLPWTVLAVISAGGVLGALARYWLSQAWPHEPRAFPWATLVVNVSGCVLIGVLMVLVAEIWPSRRLLRPFLGTGLLGGYTTFSTYVVDVQHVAAAGARATAFGYLAATLVLALAGVYAGITTTRWIVVRRAPRAPERPRDRKLRKGRPDEA